MSCKQYAFRSARDRIDVIVSRHMPAGHMQLSMLRVCGTGAHFDRWQWAVDVFNGLLEDLRIMLTVCLRCQTSQRYMALEEQLTLLTYLPTHTCTTPCACA